MYQRILKFIVIIFLSFSLYGFSRPATEEDKMGKWRQGAEGFELVLDYVPLNAYLYQFVSQDNNIVAPFGSPFINDYRDFNGEGYKCTCQFRTRGGGRVCLNFIHYSILSEVYQYHNWQMI